MNQPSLLQTGGPVSFPSFTGERYYMVPFFKEDGLPQHLRRWQPSVDDMLNGIDTDMEMYLLIDQKVVLDGSTHRRPGIHVDGYWCVDGMVAGYETGGDGHKTKDKPILPKVPTKRAPPKRRPRKNGVSMETILLASDVSACQAWEGQPTGELKDRGDATDLNTFGMQRRVLSAGRVHVGNAFMLHEPLPVLQDVQRTLIRINIPGWSL